MMMPIKGTIPCLNTLKSSLRSRRKKTMQEMLTAMSIRMITAVRIVAISKNAGKNPVLEPEPQGDDQPEYELSPHRNNRRAPLGVQLCKG